jgi:hypothetical protein
LQGVFIEKAIIYASAVVAQQIEYVKAFGWMGLESGCDREGRGIYIYIYIYIERERERERVRKG